MGEDEKGWWWARILSAVDGGKRLTSRLLSSGDIILYESHLVLYRHSLDLVFYLIGPATENELMLNSALQAFFDAVSILLRNQVEKRSVLENLDMVLLCLDETIDDGSVNPILYIDVQCVILIPRPHHPRIIIETDATTIASRVSRPRADTTDIVINEQVSLIVMTGKL